MRITLKRVYEAPAAADGRRILVDRLWPRGLTKEQAKVHLWLKELAPSTTLRKWFDHDPAKWAAFKRRYRAELAKNGEELALLKEAVAGRKATLVYAARDELHNAALVLLEALQAPVSSQGPLVRRARVAQRGAHDLPGDD